MYLPITHCVIVRVDSLPNNFIDKVAFPEYLIHKHFHVVSDVIVEMHIYACAIAHDALYGHQVLVHPVEVALLVPDVAIHLLFEVVQLVAVNFRFRLLDGFGHLWVAAHIYFLGIIGTASEGRVDIYQVYFYILVLQVSTG